MSRSLAWLTETLKPTTLHNNGYETQQNYDSFFSSGSGSGTFSSAASSNVSPGTSSGTSSSSCAAAPAPASAPGTCFWKCSASLLRLSRLSGPEEEVKVRQAITIVVSQEVRQIIRVQSTKQCEKCHTQLVDNWWQKVLQTCSNKKANEKPVSYLI